MGWPRVVPLPAPGRRGRHVSTVKWRFPSSSGSIQRQYIFKHSNTPIDSTFRAESAHVPAIEGQRNAIYQQTALNPRAYSSHVKKYFNHQIDRIFRAKSNGAHIEQIRLKKKYGRTWFQPREESNVRPASASDLTVTTRFNVRITSPQIKSRRENSTYKKGKKNVHLPPPTKRKQIPLQKKKKREENVTG